MSEIIVSIIIPVFKAEKYINKCVDSITRQTFSDYEIILIDDGSTDRCPQICDEYAAGDNRIKVIHTENKGASAARNVGIEAAEGKYILFVDADDEIDSQMLDNLYNVAVKYDADMVICNSKRVYDDIEPEESTREFDGHIIEGNSETMLEMMFYDEIFRWEPWGKLYKRELFFTDKKHRFIEGIVYEDLYLIPRLIVEANKLVYIDLPLYKYTIRKGSVMSYDHGLIVPYALVTVTEANIEYFKNNNEKNLFDMISAFMYEYIYGSLCSIILREEQRKNREFIQGYLVFMQSKHEEIMSNTLITKKKPMVMSYNKYNLFVFIRKVLKMLGRYDDK